ncbi:hypothetical protein B0H13DRAFT_2004478, partial [Mycena leptocephala]
MRSWKIGTRYAVLWSMYVPTARTKIGDYCGRKCTCWRGGRTCVTPCTPKIDARDGVVTKRVRGARLGSRGGSWSDVHGCRSNPSTRRDPVHKKSWSVAVCCGFLVLSVGILTRWRACWSEG